MDTLLEHRPPAKAAATAGGVTSVAAPSRVIAIVQANGQRIGIDGAQVVQAVVVPSDMATVPRRAGGIAGVMRHGDRLVPVVRLENWLQAPDAVAGTEEPPVVPMGAPLSADARVVILRDGNRVVGLLVDAVIGMQRCPQSAVAKLFHDERPEELFAQAALINAAEPPIALLETQRLAALAGVWGEAAQLATSSEDSVRAEAGPVARSKPANARASLGVFRIGDALVGIESDDIGELLRVPALRPPPYHHAAARGLCEWRGRLLPVVDITGELGAIADANAAAWLCVVRHRDLLLGVLLHELVELHPCEGEPPARAAGEASLLVRRELPMSRGMLQVLDTAALMSLYPESAISARQSGEAARATLVTSPHTYAVFEAAGEYAARVDSVQEVLPIPASILPRLEAGLAVSLQWRGHAVPVRALFTDAARCVSVAEARQLIVVVVGERRVAIPITVMKAMIAPRTATLARMRLGSDFVDIVSTAATSEQKASYQVVNLEARALDG